MKTRSDLVIAVAVFALGAAYLTRTAAQAPAAGAGGRGGGIGSGGTAVPYGDYTGFEKLWDGSALTNWDGETDVWSIEDGAIHADTTKTPGQHHIHYVGPNPYFGDFDLKVEMRMDGNANGGIQYRSRLLGPGHNGSIADPMGKNLPANIHTLQDAIAAGITKVPDAPATPGGGQGGGGNQQTAVTPAAPTQGCAGGGGAARGAAGRGAGAPAGGGGRGPAAPNPWQVSGYQFDMNSTNGYTGQLYEGQSRGFVNCPGGFVELLPNRQYAWIGTANPNPGAAPHAYGKDGEWNQLEIVARGHTLIHMMNGQIITVTVDDDPALRADKGILSLQLEGSGQIWYRNVYVKRLN